MPPCRWLRNRKNENVISVTQTFSSASLTAGDRPGLAAVCILSRCSWPRVSRTGGSALSDLHKNTPRSSCTNMMPCSSGKASCVRPRPRSWIAGTSPLPPWIIVAALQRSRRNRPGHYRAGPAQSSSAVACSKNCYFCFHPFLAGFLPSTPARVQNRHANVGPCEVGICVKLNKVTVERSRASTHFLGQRLSPAALLTAEVTSVFVSLEANRTRSAHFFIGGFATSSRKL